MPLHIRISNFSCYPVQIPKINLGDKQYCYVFYTYVGSFQILFKLYYFYQIPFGKIANHDLRYIVIDTIILKFTLI